MSGKGSSPRPFSVDQSTFDSNWDRIFKKKQATVWSKDGCPHCEQAKGLLKLKGIEFDERNITSGDWTREQLLEAVPTARTLPQIFLGNNYIGGFSELRQHLQG